MSKRFVLKNGKELVIIAPEPDGVCEYCGKTDELRPYGKNGERICWACGQKDPETTEKMMNRALFGTEQ